MKCCSFFSKDKEMSDKAACESKANCKQCMKNCISALVISSIVSVVAVKGFVPKVVSSHIKNNPKEIIESVENMYRNERNKAQEEASKQAPEVAQSIKSDARLPYIGNKNGSKVVIEFFDYACGFCKKQNSELQKLVAKDKDVKVILVDFPIMSPDSMKAAQIGLYIFKTEPSKFEAYYEKIGAATKPLDANLINSALSAAKVNQSVVSAALKDAIVKEVLESNYANAKKLSLGGTPALIIDKLYSHFVELPEIEKALKASK